MKNRLNKIVKNKIIYIISCAVISFIIQVLFNKISEGISFISPQPAGGVAVAISIISGWPGIVGTAIGRSLGAFVCTRNVLYSLCLFFVNIIYETIPYYMWGSFCLKEKEEDICRIDSFRHLSRYILVSLINSVIGACLTGLVNIYFFMLEDPVFTIALSCMDCFEMSMIIGLPAIVFFFYLEEKRKNTDFSIKKLSDIEKNVLHFFVLALVWVLVIFLVVHGMLHENLLASGRLSDIRYVAITFSAYFAIFVIIIKSLHSVNPDVFIRVVLWIMLVLVFIMLALNVRSYISLGEGLYSFVTIVNPVMYMVGELIIAGLISSLIIEKGKKNEQTVSFIILLFVIAIYMFMSVFNYFWDGKAELLKLNIYLTSFVTVLYGVVLLLIGRYMMLTICPDEKKYNKIYFFSIVLISILVCIAYCSIWTRQLFYVNSRCEIIVLNSSRWWLILIFVMIIYLYILIREYSGIYTTVSFVLLISSPMSEYIPIIQFMEFNLAPIFWLFGSLLCFSGIYVSRSDKLIETKKDLDFAASVQDSMLPKEFSFEGINNVEVYASMNPAKDVGGDFYDFYKLDENHVMILIADVSGKGPSAALLMMRAITAIKNFAAVGLSVDKLMEMASATINEHNDAMLFVTCWAAMINTSTGKVRFVNAGHNPPLLRHGDGTVEEIMSRPDLIMGFFPEVKYNKREMFLKPGDTLYLYTDGINEANDIKGQQYGMERLIDAAKKEYVNPRQYCENITEDVNRFMGKADQFDDMTMLAFHYEQPNGEISFDVAAASENVDIVTDKICNFAAEAGCGQRLMPTLSIVVDEIFSNIANYAYGGKQGNCRVLIKSTGKRRGIIIIFTDNGIAYNPLERDLNLTGKSLEERPGGGYGILLVMKLMDKVEYKRTSEQNKLIMTKYFDEPEEEIIREKEEKATQASVSGIRFEEVSEEQAALAEFEPIEIEEIKDNYRLGEDNKTEAPLEIEIIGGKKNEKNSADIESFLSVMHKKNEAYAPVLNEVKKDSVIGFEENAEEASEPFKISEISGISFEESAEESAAPMNIAEISGISFEESTEEPLEPLNISGISFEESIDDSSESVDLTKTDGISFEEIVE